MLFFSLLIFKYCLFKVYIPIELYIFLKFGTLTRVHNLIVSGKNKHKISNYNTEDPRGQIVSGHSNLLILT